MLTFESILPSSASRFERDVERSTAFADLPIEELGRLVDPKRIDARFLPWLAFRFGVDLWSDDWSEQKKRDVVAMQFDLQRLKGTETGIKMMLGIVDAKLLQTVTFPRRAFASAAISKEQRDEWLSRMPQVRVYFASYRGTPDASAFPGADGRKHGTFAGHSFARFEAAAAIYGRRAVLRYADGSEVSLKRSSITTEAKENSTVEFDRVHIAGDAGKALFVRGFASRGFVTKRYKQAEIVTYALDRSYNSAVSSLHLDTVAVGLDPVDVKYERFAEHVARQRVSAFISDFARHKFVTSDRAAEHIFDRVYLHDKTVDVPWIKAHSFASHARLGIPKFTAEILVEATSPRRPRAAFGGVGYCGRGFATKENLIKTKLAYAAARRSKAARDRVKMETKTTKKRTFGQAFNFGDGIKLGSRIRNRLS